MNRLIAQGSNPHEPASTSPPPLRIIIARIIAALCLAVTSAYTAVVTMRLFNFFCELIFGDTLINITDSIIASFPAITVQPFNLLPPIVLWLVCCLLVSPFWIFLNEFFGGCCEGSNAIMLGLVEAWPEPVNLVGFFSRLKLEAKTDVENTLHHRKDSATLGFLRSSEPQLSNRLQAAIYLASAALYRFNTPIADSIVTLFWRIAQGLALTYVAYFILALPAQLRR